MTSNELNRAGFSCPSLKYNTPVFKDGKMSWVCSRKCVYMCPLPPGLRPSLLAIRPRVEIILQKSHLEVGTRELGMVHECRLLNLCRQTSLPLNQGCSMGMAMTVCSLPHGGIGTVLVSSTATFTINFPLQF